MTASPRPADQRDTLTLGVILVAVGGGALALRVLPASGPAVVLAIGLGLLVAFAFLRRYAALVPGSIMTGLGAGIVASEASWFPGADTGGIIVAGLGLGFLGIWLIGSLARLPENHPWPLIPGGILTTIGVALSLGGAYRDMLDFWPLALIAVGLLVLLRAVASREGERETDPR
jgi:hypothetical protein